MPAEGPAWLRLAAQPRPAYHGPRIRHRFGLKQHLHTGEPKGESTAGSDLAAQDVVDALGSFYCHKVVLLLMFVAFLPFPPLFW